ncbi:MAG: histidinol-phosphatase [Alistipes sp.]|jgi:predicted metal-dependent phosphoesterase TrpH|nr:histidinol-phosphatase [Alistipes sp.]
MKRFVISVLALFMALSAVAQEYQTRYRSASEPQTLLPTGYVRLSRREIILPNVNGFTPYRADLHMHSTYTDGVVNIKGRMEEAWRDGLDVIATTEHLSIRPVADKEGQPTPESAKTKRGSSAVKAVGGATKIADNFGLLVIPGVELTGDAKTQGHFNALFTTDNSVLYDYDAMQTIRNARQQGALIMHNHPGWRHPTLEMTKFEEAVYAEGLVDGIELMNGPAFYPGAFDTANNHNLFMTSNTDIHATTAWQYAENGHLRNMTIIFAKEGTLSGIREALEAHRTLCYAFGTLGGDEELLKAFFEASITIKKLSVDEKTKRQRVMITNCSSLPYTIRVGKGNPVVLHPLSSTIVTAKVGKPLLCTVLNMWCGVDKHPTVTIK